MNDRETLKRIAEAARECDREHSDFQARKLLIETPILLANGVTIQRWIPVTERLPRKEEYTAMAEDGTEYYTRLLIAYKTDIVEYEIGYYDGCKWMTEMPIRLIKDVVAWMPFPEMPEPPKEDK